MGTNKSNARPWDEVVAEAEQLAGWVENYANNNRCSGEVRARLKRAAAFIREGYQEHMRPDHRDMAGDPLAQAEAQLPRSQLMQSFPLVTEGRDKAIDAIGVICAVLAPLDQDERAAVLAYVTSRYAGPV